MAQEDLSTREQKPILWGEQIGAMAPKRETWPHILRYTNLHGRSFEKTVSRTICSVMLDKTIQEISMLRNTGTILN
jgi:hypothetical protein